jgi:hypothetical protein
LVKCKKGYLYKMDKFTKIVLEQIKKKGDYGTRRADNDLAAKFSQNFTPQERIISFYFVDHHGRGKKYPPMTVDRLVNTYIGKLGSLRQYQNKDYIFILDTDSQKTGKKESLWDVFVIRKNAAFPNVDNKRIDSVVSGYAGQAPILSLKAFQKLKTTIASEIAAAEKARIEKEKEEAAEKAEKEKLEAQQNITKKALSGNIDVNNLGSGTTDAKAFQELLYLIGKSLASDTTEFKNFAKYRNERNGQPGWKGNIGEQSLELLNRLNLKKTWEKGNAGKTSVIKELHDALPNTNESINYFKGINMNIKLKDLINEQLRVKSDDEMKVPVIPTKPTKPTKPTNPDTNSDDNNKTGDGTTTDACAEINKYTNQYYTSTTVAEGSINGPRAVVYDIWKLYTNAASEIKSNFENTSFWSNYKSGWGDDETSAVNWYWGGYYAKSGGKFYDYVYKPYIQKALDLTRKYADAVRECGDEYDKQFINLFGTSSNPFGKNWDILRSAWISGRRKTYGDTGSDTFYIKLEHPRGVSSYEIDTDF